jgi:hypothetical protein
MRRRPVWTEDLVGLLSRDDAPLLLRHAQTTLAMAAQ